MPTQDAAWRSDRHRQACDAIRAAGETGVTPTELANLLGTQAGNLRSILQGLVDEGLLAQVANSPRPGGRRGHWPAHRFVLTLEGNAALEERPVAPPAGTPLPAKRVARRVPPRRATRPQKPSPPEPPARTVDPGTNAGVLRTGDQVVWADVAAQALPELFHVLTDAEPLGRAAWSAVVDGDKQEYAIVFRGDRATADALDLLGLLAAARIDARRTVVSEVADAGKLREDAAQRTAAARRARLGRDTRAAS